MFIILILNHVRNNIKTETFRLNIMFKITLKIL
jgi:hypothetical protein